MSYFPPPPPPPPPPTGTKKLVTVTFTKLEVIHDQDGWLEGAGDIFIQYTVLNGDVHAGSGFLPGWDTDGTPVTVGVSDGQSWDPPQFGPHARFEANTSQIQVKAMVFDEDNFLTGDNDKLLQDLNRIFYSSANYGAGAQVHATNDYRLHYTITSVTI
jgi:hypothetical protein